MVKFIAWVVAVGVSGSAVLAADSSPWPQFRGPNGSGVADDQKPPVEVGPEKNVKWKVAVPSGPSSPIVAGDKLVLTAFEDGKLFTIAYDRATGAEAWRALAPAKIIEPFNKPGSPAASTPVTDGKRIIAYFGSCGLVCYDLAGKELWKFEMPVAAVPGEFGSGTSPILADGKVIVVRDEMKDSRIIAIDATSGKPAWETKRRSVSSYCTPVAWDTPSGKQIVAAGHAQMVGYDLNSGEERWLYNGLPSSCCTSPVVANGALYFAGWSPGGPDDSEFQMPEFDAVLKGGDTDKDAKISKAESEKTMLKNFFDSTDMNTDGFVSRDEWDNLLKFMTEGKNSVFALKAGGTGDLTESSVLWKQTKGMPYIASAILYRGQYVMVKDGGIVTALDAQSGKELYMKRAVAAGSYYASPIAAGGHIYFVSLADGAITVLKAGTKQPEVAAENPPLGERVAATPAIADNRLYVRTEKHLYAFGGE